MGYEDGSISMYGLAWILCESFIKMIAIDENN